MKKTIIAAGAAAVLLAGGAGYALASTDDRDDVPEITRSTSSPSPSRVADADGRADDRGGDAGRIDLRDDDDDRDDLTGETLQRAADAALAHTGGGRVTDAEKSDDDDRHEYEVEVTMDDGSEYDIDLDKDFAVVDVDHDTDD
ncbi:hypothetical protein EHW97_01815 [Aeromicrobium camelliae]|uniref:PepSY domain-containing protein n=1 Tax=Aeromicrobium camelliae TaxID=1538144 RepID=A0A3N6WQM6_9ACTN|nr:PepSY domain-containing protein [Aeromicrobium camelliae]RQN09610.1 hypothetical protein EHW97_01815 [Aeromicrobium camelliae]